VGLQPRESAVPEVRDADRKSKGWRRGAGDVLVPALSAEELIGFWLLAFGFRLSPFGFRLSANS
jgi:hypothetical protein